MKYSELIQFQPIESRVQLGHADRVEEAERLVATYFFSEEMIERLICLVMPHLRFDPLFTYRGVFIIGRPGSGKSHLMSVLSLVAEHGELSRRLTHPKVAEAAALIAGSFKVIRVELGQAKTGFRDLVCARLEAGLADWGIHYHFPPRGRSGDGESCLAEMMAEFHLRFPTQGLLLVVDDLPDSLCKPSPGNALDAAFLRDLSGACEIEGLRFLAALEEHPEDSAAPSDPIPAVHDRFLQVPIPGNNLGVVVANRLLKKTPEQQAAIREHLAPFARFYGNIRERMEDFVALFPVHPDYLKVVGNIPYIRPRDALRALSDAVRGLLRQTVAPDRPGLITYDSYWDTLRSNRALRSVPELEGVAEYNELVRSKIEPSFPRSELREMALRLVHALSVHRLTTGDVYGRHGPTPVELRDSLCLHLPGIEEMGGEPDNDLLLHVVAVLDVVVSKSVRGQYISYNPENGQYFLHLRDMKRFVKPELALHWINGIPFLLLLATGGMMFVARFSQMDDAWFNLVVLVHKTCAATWVLLVPLTVLLRPKVHWQHIRPMLKWGIEDIVWMVQSVRSLVDKKAVVPPAGRFNTGQKMNACLVMLYFIGFTATGTAIMCKGSMLFPWYVHTCLFVAAAGSVGGHLYLALINPSTRIALGGIFHGWAPMKYVEHHHFLSLPRSLRSQAKHAHPHVTARTILEGLLAPRARMGLLAAALVIGGLATIAYNQTSIASVEKVFARSLSESIKPGELSPKHRQGATGESCAQCHAYAGGIPDDKCERCHEEVAGRRANRIGYHGSLKGACILCHQEHLPESQSIVPLDRESFDHNLANFRREGKHAQVACDDCHQKKRTPDTPGIYYLGLKHDLCSDCHDDPHAGQLRAACEQCHSPTGWRGDALKFTHDANSSFKLVGKHRDVACSKCHHPGAQSNSLGTAVFKGLPDKCSGCHDEPHQRQFAMECNSCHSPAGWDRAHLSFDHNVDSRFPLTDKHTEVACEKCHPPASPGDRLGWARFRDLKSACADCHKDPHEGQFELACTKCHDKPAAWSLARLQFEHDRDTEYPLVGKHAGVDCIRCHKPQTPGGSLASARFTELETGCEACHNVQHPPPYGSRCTSCHTFAAWPKKDPGFQHIFDCQIAGENLSGRHLTAECSKCHDGVKIGPLQPSRKTEYHCQTCHQKEDPHNGVLGRDCLKCHGMDGWKGNDLRFDHNRMASFALDQDHRRVACAKCHENGHWKPLEAKCESCHTKLFLDKKK